MIDSNKEVYFYDYEDDLPIYIPDHNNIVALKQHIDEDNKVSVYLNSGYVFIVRGTVRGIRKQIISQVGVNE